MTKQEFAKVDPNEMRDHIMDILFERYYDDAVADCAKDLNLPVELVEEKLSKAD